MILGVTSTIQVNEKPIKENKRYIAMAIHIETNNFFILFCCFEINKRFAPVHKGTGTKVVTLECLNKSRRNQTYSF